MRKGGTSKAIRQMTCWLIIISCVILWVVFAVIALKKKANYTELHLVDEKPDSKEYIKGKEYIKMVAGKIESRISVDEEKIRNICTYITRGGTKNVKHFKHDRGNLAKAISNADIIRIEEGKNEK